MNRDKPRLPLPALLLFLGCVLSCSTACITSALIDNVAGQSRLQAITKADADLEKTRLDQSGQTGIPTITADTDLIERALRPALPIQRDGMRRSSYKNVIVVLQKPTGPSKASIYLITAYGDFDPSYAAAFTRFANKLSHQLPVNCWFVVETYTGTPDARTKVDNFSVY
jgi:hypothetical protein